MNFCENIVNLRKQNNLSQEELADKLGVSRQAVSKWESGGTYPDMDKLLSICEIFNCTIDQLVKGKVNAKNDETYKNFYNTFALSISSGVFLIIFGLATALIMYEFMDNNLVVPIATFFSLVFIAVPILVYNGLKEDDFKKQQISNPYTKEDYFREFAKSFNLAIVSGISIILIGIVVMLAVYELTGKLKFLSAGAFMYFVSVAVFLFTYFGIKEEMYQKTKSVFDAKEWLESNEKTGKISGVIMISATILFLILGFIFELWSKAWVVFPIGAMLCGIVGTIYQPKIGEKK